MIDPVSLQMVRDVVTIFGVLIGLASYVMSVRNANKTRQMQLISQFSDSTSEEIQKRGLKLLSLEWSDYDDFEKKYGSDHNPDNYAMRYAAWSNFNRLGYLLKEGLIEIEHLQGLFSGAGGALWHWHKYESIIKEQRKRYNLPTLFVWFEYLANEMVRWYKMNGYSFLVPEKYVSYVPDE
ncbi:MAG: DUF4760 domain-containing protein [Candidatus Thorarchaeota archaeon]|jgi:hypothetical protein